MKLIASYADGTTPNLDGYRCHWKFSPSLPAPAPADGVCAIEIANTPDLFRDKNHVNFILSINVEAVPPGSNNSVQLDQTRTYTLSLYNYSAPKVDITPSTLELGQTAPARFNFTEGVVPTERSCSWTPSDQFQTPNDCDTTFVAPRNTGLFPDGMVPVQVTVTTKDIKLASNTFQVTVRYPPAKLYDFVLDATANMKPVMDGITFLDRAKANISSQVVRLEPTGGWLAIVGFGQDMPGVRDDCDRYKTIYPLARINVQEANKAFSEVHIVGQIAPLAKAIDTAVKQYSDLRPLYPGKDVEGSLVLLTASENGCQNMTLADAIAEMETAFHNNGVSVQYYGQTIFTSVIVVALPNTGPRASQVYSTPVYQREQNHTLLIVAESPQDVEDAVTAITNLSDADYNVRQRGCATLRSLVARHNDKKSLAILTKPCRG